jgi:hypothetical protein
MRNRNSLAIYGIAICFALLSLVFSLGYTRANGYYDGLDDGDWYLGYASNLIDGVGYVDCEPDATWQRCTESDESFDQAYRLPGYPSFLAGLRLLFGNDNFLPPIRLFQSVLAAMIVFLTVVYAQRWGRLAGIVAGISMLVCWSMYYFAYEVITEILFTFLLLIFFLLFTRSHTPTTVFFAGLVLGGCMLTRGVLLFTLPFLFFVKKQRRLFFVLMAGTAIPILLWTARNYVVFDAFVPFSTGAGKVFWGANNIHTYGTMPGTWIKIERLPEGAILEGLDELGRNNVLWQDAFHFLQTAPAWLILRAVPLKLLAFLGLWEPIWYSGTVIIWLTTWISTLIIAMRNMQLRRRIAQLWQHESIRLITVLLIGALLNTLFFYGYSRFRFPYEPYLSITAGIAVTLLVKPVKRTKTRPSVANADKKTGAVM